MELCNNDHILLYHAKINITKHKNFSQAILENLVTELLNLVCTPFLCRVEARKGPQLDNNSLTQSAQYHKEYHLWKSQPMLNISPSQLALMK